MLLKSRQRFTHNLGVGVLDTRSSYATLVDILHQRAARTPDKVGYIYLKDGQADEVKFTYQQMDRRARQIAKQLQSRTQPGDRVVINHLPGLDYIASFFGCLYASTVAVPVYPPRFNQKLDRLNSILKDCQPKAALTSKSILETVQPLIKDNPHFEAVDWVVTEDSSQLDVEGFEPIFPSLDDLAFIQYTSGSTSDPKGVMLTHGNLIANLECITDRFQANENDVAVIWLPPYHDMGLIGGVLTPSYIGFPLVLMSPYAFLQRPLRWLQTITKYKATATGGPNFAYELCSRRITEEQKQTIDLSSLRLSFCGAEPIRADVVREFTNQFSVCGFTPQAFFPCYGLAEATLMVSAGEVGTSPTIRTVDGDTLEKQGLAVEVDCETNNRGVRTFVGCGNAPSRHTLKIVDPVTLEECPEGAVGEIWFCGPSVAKGYWNRPADSEKTFGAKVRGGTGESFLRTGDLGFIKEGQLFVTGRLKDLLIFRGRNFYPQDIELTVAKSHEALRAGAGAAFSILEREEEKLVIVHELDRSSRDANLDEVVEAIRQNVFETHGLNPYAISLIKTNSIPLTSSGKIQRHASRKLFLQGQLNEKLRFIEGCSPSLPPN